MRRPYAFLTSSRANGTSASWYWRVLAYVSSWSLLSGYLILPSLFDKDPQLRIPGIVLTVLAVALLTVGFSVSALLFFACSDFLFRRDQLFIPCFSASFLGLLTLLFHFVVSTRYQWTAAAIAGTILSCAAAVIYGLLALWVNSDYTTVKHQRNSSTSHVPLRSDDTSYYSTDTFPAPLNAQPVDSQPGIYVYPSGEAVQAMPMRPVVFDDTDEERTRQQMLTLLLRANPEATAGRERSPSNSSTYHIDLPQRRMTNDELEELRSRVPASNRPQRVWVENPVTRSEALAPSSHSHSHSQSHSHSHSHSQSHSQSRSRPHSRSHSHTHSSEWETEDFSVGATVDRSSIAKPPRNSSAPREPPSVLVSSPHATAHEPAPPPQYREPLEEQNEAEEMQEEGSSDTPQLITLPAARYVPRSTPAKRERRRQEIEGGNNNR